MLLSHLIREYTGGVHRNVGMKYQAVVLNRKAKRSLFMTRKNTCAESQCCHASRSTDCVPL